MISIVIPTMNEAENIKRLIPQIYKSVMGEIEVLIVDKSTDNTRATVYGMLDDYPNLRYMAQKGEGFASAIIEGVNSARGEVIVTMDADNHMPSEISKLLDCIEKENADVVVGSRFMKGSDVDLEKKRLLSSKLGNKIINAALKLNIKDCSSGFRVYRAKSVKAISDKIRTEYFSVQVEILGLIKENGGKLCEIPIHYIEREDGKSKFKYKSAIKDGATLLKIARDKKLNGIKERVRRVRKRAKRRKRLNP